MSGPHEYRKFVAAQLIWSYFVIKPPSPGVFQDRFLVLMEFMMKVYVHGATRLKGPAMARDSNHHPQQHYETFLMRNWDLS